ncbi:MAG: hypothetical protein QNK37_08210 [Acidobacteriota bacterium]|nr:hypothetical protein [Acidobacteriota bacterium]
MANTISVHFNDSEKTELDELDKLAQAFGMSRSQVIKQGISLVVKRLKTRQWRESMLALSGSIAEDELDIGRNDEIVR